MLKLEKKNITNLINSMIALFFIAWFFTLVTKWGNWNSSYELGLAVGQKFRIMVKDFVTIALIYAALIKRRKMRA